MTAFGVIGIEEGLVLQHCTGDFEQSVCHGSEGTAMGLAPGSQGGIFGAAGRIALHGDTSPMIEGVSEPAVAGLSHDDTASFSASAGHGRDARQRSQGMVISCSQRLEGFGKQRGTDDSSYPGQGREDLQVTLLIILLGAETAEPIELGLDFADLSVDQLEAFGGVTDMCRGGFAGSLGNSESGLAQPRQDLVCRDLTYGYGGL